MNYLLIIYFILFIILNRLSLKSTILLLIFLTPAYLIRFSIFGIPTNILEASIIISFLFWIYYNRNFLFKFKKPKDKDSKTYPFRWEIILILAISFLSIFTGNLSFSALGIFKSYFLIPIIFYILILNNFKFKKDLEKIIYALTCSVVLISLVAIWQKISGQYIFNEFWANPENRRVVSIFSYPNAIALFIGPIIPLIAGLFVSKLKNKASFNLFLKQLFLFSSLILGLLAIYFSKSKGALLALTLVLFFIIFIKIKRKLKITILIVLIILIPIISYNQKDWIKLKISTSLSYQIRQAQWQETIEMLMDNNILYGSGLANYQEKIKKYHQEGIFFNKDADPDFKRKIFIFDDKYRAERWQPLEIYLYPHNIFLNFWTELGLSGMIIFSFLIIKFLILSFKIYLQKNKDKYLSLALFSSVLILVIHGLFDVPYFKNDLAILFWIIISLLAILILNKDKKI